MTRNRISRTCGLALALAVIGAGAAACRAGDPAGADDGPRIRALRAQLALSDAERFVLVLDEQAPSLSLYLGPVPLHRYAVLSVARPRRTAFFVSLPVAADPSGVTWQGGVQEPERVRARRELEYAEAGDDDDAQDASPPPAAPKIPPTPEEAVPAPEQWVLRFEGGFETWFQGIAGEGEAPPPPIPDPGRVKVLRDLLDGVVPPARLLVRMPLEDAQALYRSLPPDVAFLIVPARPGSPAAD